MSTEMTKMAADARLLHERVFVPAYFDTLAELGISPRTEKQAEAFLRIGQRLLAEEQAVGVKQAAADEDLIVRAADDLERMLSGDRQAGPDLDPAAVKQAALSLINDPEIAAAAASIQGAVLARRAR